MRRAGGQPLADVRISDGTRNTWTDSSGHYALVNAPAGSYTLNATRFGYVVSPSGFSNPVTAPATSIDFTAAAASYSLSGETIQGALFGSGNPDAGVTVHAGTLSTVSDAHGKFSWNGPMGDGGSGLGAGDGGVGSSGSDGGAHRGPPAPGRVGHGCGCAVGGAGEGGRAWPWGPALWVALALRGTRRRCARHIAPL